MTVQACEKNDYGPVEKLGEKKNKKIKRKKNRGEKNPKIMKSFKKPKNNEKFYLYTGIF